MDNLKKSLSETLSHFDPLAGTITKENQSILCDDYGVEFLETRVDVKLSNVLKHHVDGCILNRFVSTNLHYNNESGNSRDNLLQVVVQVNIFDCGGMVIGVSVLHKIADAATASTFVSAWARTNALRTNAECKNVELITPSFDSASLFPPKEVPSFVLSSQTNQEDNDIVFKRFVFDSSKINPTKVETVSALLWKCVSKVAGKAEPAEPSKPFYGHSLGNLLAPVMEGSMNNPSENELSELVGNMRAEIRKLINGDYLKSKYKGNYELLSSMGDIHERFNKGDLTLYTITSWCRFPFYETDFGWGKPIWVCTVSVSNKNACTLIDTRDGNGVEAWVTLDKYQMSELETDQELREFASMGPITMD
ncbi:hypothetical protein MKW98_007951 [Papaver atlanticum]|uniref:Uncharacterized protein n=1 Tax=Papaver atlanticum TaxID=357466 RepID=A0AAD4S899_9MAGN|nr:hypothetical protein MKW98_007951 [Papaver atlanticum]